MKFSFIPVALILAAALFASCAGTLPRIVKFDTRPETPFRGDTVLLEWVVRGADKVTLDGTPVPDSAGMKVYLDKSKTFTLKATATRAESTKILDIVAQPR
jgi:hypothetical protein